jgi:putative transposase
LVRFHLLIYSLVLTDLGVLEFWPKIQRRQIEPRRDYVNQDWLVTHAMLPIQAHDPIAGRTGRPWLTTIMDGYSNCIVGFRVELDPPTAATILRAFHVGMAPKHYILDRHDRGLPVWECFGIPNKLWLDRGSECELEVLSVAADVFGVLIAFQTQRKPWIEGALEDWFGRIKADSHGDLCIGAGDWMDCPRAAADELPLLYMSGVSRIITHWVIDYYHEKVNRDLCCTPAEKWRQGLRDVAPLPTSPYDTMMFAC